MNSQCTYNIRCQSFSRNALYTKSWPCTLCVQFSCSSLENALKLLCFAFLSTSICYNILFHPTKTWNQCHFWKIIDRLLSDLLNVLHIIFVFLCLWQYDVKYCNSNQCRLLWNPISKNISTSLNTRKIQKIIQSLINRCQGLRLFIQLSINYLRVCEHKYLNNIKKMFTIVSVSILHSFYEIHLAVSISHSFFAISSIQNTYS